MRILALFIFLINNILCVIAWGVCESSQWSHHRRFILSIPFWTVLPLSQSCSAEPSAVQVIRRSAASIPGYGKADIFFPSRYIGKWSASHNILIWDEAGFCDGSLPPFSLRDHQYIQQHLPISLIYNVRFIHTGDEVVADRAFNERNFYSALVGFLNDKDKASNPALLSRRQVQDVDWTDTNPNVLRMIFNDGSRREVKVTKRATTMDEKQNNASSSEYTRITTSLNTEDGRNIPMISACRSLTKWRLIESDANTLEHLDAIELVYSDGVMGDPLAPSEKSVSSVLVRKSIIRLSHRLDY